MWVLKDAKFYTDSISEGKTEIKRTTKKLLSNNCFFVSFLKITFYRFTFSQFHLQIWNKHKILRFLVGTHIDLFEEKKFQLYLKKILGSPLLYGFVSVGETQYIHAQSCWGGGGARIFF